jgi:hypothetical protein
MIIKLEEQLRKYASVTALIHSLSGGNQSPTKIMSTFQNSKHQQGTKKDGIDGEIEDSLYNLNINDPLSQDVA